MGHQPELQIEQRKLLDLHLELVLKENERSNLTRIVDWQQGQLLHIEDSLVGLQEFEDAPSGRAADLGSGGGFPGIPLAIVSGRPIMLVDSVAKKTTALEMPESFAVITARALSSLPSLLELAVPLLSLGGQLICYKAAVEAEELEQAAGLEEKLGMKLVSMRTTQLSDNETNRTILVYEKVGEPMVSLPRRPGMAQKRPYKA